MSPRVALVVVVALASALCEGCFLPPPDCIEGAEVGDRLVLHIVEPYTRESRFRWNPPAASGPFSSSCDGLGDIAPPVDIAVTLLRRVRTGTSCNMFAAIAEGVAGVDLVDPGERVDLDQGLGTIGSVRGTCDNRWRMSARSHNGRAGVIGMAAVEGQLPPVVVTRTVQGSCFGVEGMGCTDFFVAELRRE